MSTPADMFKIIGGDGREYGPVELSTIQQWIREGRLRAESRIWDSRTGAWTTAAQIPELADMFAPPPISAPPPASEPPPPPPFNFERQAVPAPPGLELAHTIRERGYEPDISAWVSDGWKLYTAHLGTALGACWAVFGIIFACAIVGVIPCIGDFIRLVMSFVFQPPLIAGIYVALLAVLRRRMGNISLVFEPFSTSWLQTCLVNLMIALIMAAVCLPGIILMVVPIITGDLKFDHHVGPHIASSSSFAFVVLFEVMGALLLLAAATYLSVAYMFGMPLAADKRMSFWDAMETSRRVVNRHWFSLFGLGIVIFLLNVLGALVCCVGFVFTMPLGFCILTAAYESIFTLRAAPKSSPTP